MDAPEIEPLRLPECAIDGCDNACDLPAASTELGSPICAECARAVMDLLLQLAAADPKAQ